ncbi:MAG TPA: hypothetical protein VGK79_08950 [Gaiellaceae bacterium]|jgi:hypothetical protein
MTSVELERREDWRAWLEQHHATSDGVWLVTWKKVAKQPRVDYDAAVEEALCFGWVDTKSKSVDELRTALWFTRRRPGSSWSESNVARFEKLEAAGVMTAAGRACYPGRTDSTGLSREISASRSSLRGFESCDLEPQALNRSRTTTWNRFKRSV